jgi:hypothetical protein
MATPPNTIDRYNTTKRQRLAILQRLASGPATVDELVSDCHAPDPRKRISDLRRAGHRIDTTPHDRTNPDGSVNRVGLYVLSVTDNRQCELNFNQ